jgi:hypothetical protein
MKVVFKRLQQGMQFRTLTHDGCCAKEHTWTVVLDDHGEISLECENCGEPVTLSEIVEEANK